MLLGEEIYIRNAALYAGDGIINLRRSGPAYVAITLVIPLYLGFHRKAVTSGDFLSWKWLGDEVWCGAAAEKVTLRKSPEHGPSVPLGFCR